MTSKLQHLTELRERSQRAKQSGDNTKKKAEMNQLRQGSQHAEGPQRAEGSGTARDLQMKAKRMTADLGAVREKKGDDIQTSLEEVKMKPEGSGTARYLQMKKKRPAELLHLGAVCAKKDAFGVNTDTGDDGTACARPLCAEKDAFGVRGKLISTDSGDDGTARGDDIQTSLEEVKMKPGSQRAEGSGACGKLSDHTVTSLEEVKKKISVILKVYVEETRDVKEACRCIRQLGVSYFHHEVVKSALITGVESCTAQPLVVNLLMEALSEKLISSLQVVKAFSMLRESLDHLAHIPSAKTNFDSLVRSAVSLGYLEASFGDDFVEFGDH